jgi:hypothetical protein
MKKLLLGIFIVFLLTGCYSPTYITPTPVPTISPIPILEPYTATIPTIKTYTAYDYAYSFNYPSGWEDVTNKLAHFWKGNTGSPDFVPDIILGLYPDEYHGIYIAPCRFPALDTSLPLMESLDTQALESLRVQGWDFGATEYISGKETLVLSYDYPKTYSRCKLAYLLGSNELLVFIVEAMGEKYYNIFDDTYSTFVNSLQVK